MEFYSLSYLEIGVTFYSNLASMMAFFARFRTQVKLIPMLFTENIVCVMEAYNEGDHV